MYCADINDMLQALARDLGFHGKTRIDLDHVLQSRKRFLEGGLAGSFDDLDLPLQEVRRRLQFVEFAAKAFGLNDSRPQPATDTFIRLQDEYLRLADDVVQMDEKDLTDLSFIVRTITDRPWSWETFRKECRHGPGATFDGLRSCDKWLGAIREGEISHHLDPLSRLKRVAAVRTSRYYDVPKTFEKNRGICAEPTEAQFLQQGIGAFLARCVRPFADITDQRRNQQAAIMAGTCTLDLSSASDRVSYALCALLLEPGLVRPADSSPLQWFELAKATRSHWCVIPSGCKGPTEVIELSSMASMGNGFCFPLLTTVCVSVCILSYMRTRRIPIARHLTYRSLLRLYRLSGAEVYGDDIVVKDDDVPLTRYYLEACGLRVNTLKSSSPGSSFKETCGIFTYRGIAIKDILRVRKCGEDIETLLHLCDLQRRAREKFFTELASVLAMKVMALAQRLGLTRCVQIMDASRAERYAFDLSASAVLFFTAPSQQKRLESREWRAFYRWSISCAAQVRLATSKRYQQTYVSVSKRRDTTRPLSLADGSAWAQSLFTEYVRQLPEKEGVPARVRLSRQKVYSGTRCAA